MKTGEILKAVLKERGITQTQLAEMMGYASQSAVGNKIKLGCTTNLFVEFMDKLGYEVVVQPKTQGKRKDGAMLLTNGDDKS